MIEIEYAKRYGLLEMDNCPDCNRPLMSLRKISNGNTSKVITAKVCVNTECFRFIEPCHLKTWADEKGNPLDRRLPLPNGAKVECEWIYKNNNKKYDAKPFPY
jgi:uncharacterized protein with PIN domain